MQSEYFIYTDMFQSNIALDLQEKCSLSFYFLIFIPPVGESQQVSAVGGSDIPEDPGKDPGESDEQPGNLDRLAVPAQRCKATGKGIHTLCV